MCLNIVSVFGRPSWISRLLNFKYGTLPVRNKHQNKFMKIMAQLGQERFRTITSAYYRGADAIIVVYDVCNELSFEHVQDWITEVQRFTSDDTCRLLVGNKSDRADRTVSTDRAQVPLVVQKNHFNFDVLTVFAQRYAQSQGMQFLETSAKEASNVDMAFLMVTAELVKSR